MFGMMDGSQEMWTWAAYHPYLFTFIKISTPTMIVVLMYAASKIMGLSSSPSPKKKRR